LPHGSAHLLYDAARGNHLNSGESMKRLLAAALLLGLMPALTLTSAQNQKPEVAKVSLKVGDVAPDFSLLSDQWKTIKLSDYRGKKNVMLAIYVLAFTGG
jgi:cytochrome oxidase Cu insertion factor (SCO1/SenC/PrrC family)